MSNIDKQRIAAVRKLEKLSYTFAADRRSQRIADKVVG